MSGWGLPECLTLSRHVGVRNRDGELQTPIVRFRNPATGEKVHLIGTVHFGDSSYYEYLRSYIGGCEDAGCRVLYELPKPMTAKERHGLSDAEIAILKGIEGTKRVICDTAAMLDCQLEADGLAAKPGWINTDLSMREIVGLLAHEGVLPIRISRERFRPTAFRERAANALLMHFGLYAAVSTAWDAVVHGAEYRVIVSHRNRLGFNAIMANVDEREVVALWGCRHVTGISTLLRAAGFEETEVIWVAAYRNRESVAVRAARAAAQ